MRFYGFTADELTPAGTDHLDLAIDPKLAWALAHPEAFPVDANRAPRERLLRVPGLGQRTVKRLLQVRRHHRVTLRDLGRLGASIKKARPFVVAADSTAPAQLLDRVDLAARVQTPRQMSLLEAAASAGNGEL